jgi:hypothetical protein
MKKLFFLLFSIVYLLNSQTKNEYFDGQFLTLKAGYHTEDKIQSVYGFTDGFSVDANLEIPTGKNWYFALGYDLSFAKVRYYDYYGFTYDKITIKSYSLMVKYRFVHNRVAPYAAAGFGGSSILDDKMLALNLRVGFEYSASKNIVIISEAAYYEMSEFNIGGGRNNRMFQIKLGLGFAFNYQSNFLERKTQ